MKDFNDFFNDCDDILKENAKCKKENIAKAIRTTMSLSNDCIARTIDLSHENEVDLAILKIELDEMLDQKNFLQAKIIAKQIEEQKCKMNQQLN